MQVEGCTLSPLCGDGEEEDLELSVLPKNTKVVVTGNNRTNRDLLGLHGVVKKAVGFGWHWLVLTNGSEVKLQRNALSVIELPTGQEEDGENDCEHPSSNNNSMDLGCDDLHKTYKPKSRSRVLGGSSSRNHSHSAQLQSSGSNFHSHGMLKVDLSKLETSALWRYWRHFNLVEVGPNPSKDQLVGAVERHFISQVITGFVQAAKRLKTVCS